MRLKSVQVESYKSLLKPASVELAPGFNVIVGQNNAGKTALVEAMSLTFGNHPTRTLETMPDRTPRVLTNSSVVAKFDLSGAELRSWLEGHASVFSLPVPDPSAVIDYIARLNRLLQGASITVQAHYPSDTIHPTVLVEMGGLAASDFRTFRINRTTGEVEIEPNVRGGQNMLDSLSQYLRSCIYAFRAERVVAERRSVVPSPRLEPDASNLAAVLLKLQRNPAMLTRYNRMVSSVLPQIKQVSADPTGSDTADVLVWGLDPTNEREDLALPLSTCGTGVGQVLAILYVAVIESSPRTIIIDEPQSFLHPGAVRKLLDVLKGFPQHQYVITTHSPAVISAANPATLTVVRKTEAGTSEVEQLSGTTAALEDLLAELGANLSDVFGVEAVIWVEGATEERCLRIVVDEVMGRSLLGTAIIGVVATGDFEVQERRKGEAERTIQIYQRLSRSGSVVPAKAAFIFDREGRDEAAREDIRRRAPAQVHFLDRRMYENYLLNPDAIEHLLKSLREGSTDVPSASELSIAECSAAAVCAWMEEHRLSAKYYEKGVDPAAFAVDAWKTDIHAANFLGDLVRHFAGPGYEYLKVLHGSTLTRWIAAHAPQEFDELRQLLGPLLPEVPE